VTQWKSAITSQRGRIASSVSSSVKGFSTRPPIVSAGRSGTAGHRSANASTPKRGKKSIARWPGGTSLDMLRPLPEPDDAAKPRRQRVGTGFSPR
jgi:hypothetical protein